MRKTFNSPKTAKGWEWKRRRRWFWFYSRTSFMNLTCLFELNKKKLRKIFFFLCFFFLKVNKNKRNWLESLLKEFENGNCAVIQVPLRFHFRLSLLKAFNEFTNRLKLFSTFLLMHNGLVETIGQTICQITSWKIYF